MPEFTTYWSGLSSAALSDAAKVGVTDSAGYLTATNVESALAELAGVVDPTEIWVPASSMSTVSGVITTTYSAVIACAFAPSASAFSNAAATVLIPRSWTAVDVDVYWCNNGTNSGNVVWRCDHGAVINGSVVTRTVGSNVTAAAPTVADEVEVTEIATAVSVTGGTRHAFSIGRNGSDAADTLTDTGKILGFALRSA